MDLGDKHCHARRDRAKMKTRPLCLTFFFAATIVESSFSNGTLGLDGFQVRFQKWKKPPGILQAQVLFCVLLQEFLLSAQDRFGDGGGLLHVEMPHHQVSDDNLMMIKRH